MSNIISYLSQVPTVVMLAVGLVILWRYRRRSRPATVIAFAGLCGLAGLWLFGFAYWWVWKNWQDEFDLNSLDVLRVYIFGHAFIDSACILLLVIATVIDRPQPGQRPELPTGPAADFEDAPASGSLRR
jgi:ABC-type phosphate/phosphonate transport system permease subunit